RTVLHVPCPFLLVLVSTRPPPTELYTLSLHDALPICGAPRFYSRGDVRLGNPSTLTGGQTEGAKPIGIMPRRRFGASARSHPDQDRKSTRLNSSHVKISYAVFCLKKKKNNTSTARPCT